MSNSILRDKAKDFAKNIVFLCRNMKSEHKEIKFMKRTMFNLFLLVVCLSVFSGCSQYDDSKTNTDADSPVCSMINLAYHGNKQNSITIEDKDVCSDLMAFISKAGGTQGDSSKGHYGIPYTMTAYFEGNEEPLVFYLWSETQYSTSKHTDSDGYPLFFNDDLTDLYQYLEENYPYEFWYENTTESK